MNITIDREVLLENLNIISRGLPSKSPMPILTGIKYYNMIFSNCQLFFKKCILLLYLLSLSYCMAVAGFTT